MKKILFLILSLVAVYGCSDDNIGLEKPEIVMDEVRFLVELGESITIQPSAVKNVDEQTTYTWTLDGEVQGTQPSYTFRGVMVGDSYLTFRVTNSAGFAEVDLKVSTYESEKDPFEGAYIPSARTDFHWEFPKVVYNLSEGRVTKVKAYFLENDKDGTYEWTLDGKQVAEPTTRAERAVEYMVKDLPQGQHELLLTHRAGEESHIQAFTLNICPPEGTYRRMASATSQAMVNKVYEFMPAPGHQVNGYTVTGPFGPDGMSMAQACDSVYSHFQKKYMTSLGAQGGYLIAGFDHSVENSGEVDLCIKGNPYSYQSEPGIIWVSQDENGNGLPDDTWYELAGSEYGTENEITDYAVTYYRPKEPGKPVYWKDNQGNTGIVPYMKTWNPQPYYWQDWVEGEEKTYFGSYLKNNVTYENGFSTEPPFPWGYADQVGSDYYKDEKKDAQMGSCGYFKISNAVNVLGQKVNLKYIDFVKVQTAQQAWTPNLGDVSTEVYYISDYHLEK